MPLIGTRFDQSSKQISRNRRFGPPFRRALNTPMRAELGIFLLKAPQGTPPQNGSTSINMDQHEDIFSTVAHTLMYCCTHSNILFHALYNGARTIYWSMQALGKQKYIMRLEIRYFFLEIRLSPSISRKKYLISNLIIYFHFQTELSHMHSNILA